MRGIVANSRCNLAVKDGGSHWSIKSSAEASEEIIAVTDLSTRSAWEFPVNQAGHLAYVGYPSGIETLAADTKRSAFYNSTGAFRTIHFIMVNRKPPIGEEIQFRVQIPMI